MKFIFATTEPNKIPITILSRCQRFDFAGIDMGAIQTRLAQIAAAEGVEIEPEAVQILASRAAGSMRDSQSLLGAIAGRARTSGSPRPDVHALLGTAPAERLSGLVSHLVGARRGRGAGRARRGDRRRRRSRATARSTDRLFPRRDGGGRRLLRRSRCSTRLPSQADEVAAIGRQLGLQTILAMVQILDQTAARLRVSLHGRTLVEMAIVRICQLDDLDDLAALVAELRGEPSERRAAPRPAEPAKKNVEPRPASQLRIGARSRRCPKPAASRAGRSRDCDEPAAEARAPPTNGAAHEAADSVLKQFQLAVEAAKSAAPSRRPPPRVSRRQQAAEQVTEVSERPFVQRALELFEVAPGQFRYSPPTARTNDDDCLTGSTG